jgi:hypothetical protein
MGTHRRYATREKGPGDEALGPKGRKALLVCKLVLKMCGHALVALVVGSIVYAMLF